MDTARNGKGEMSILTGVLTRGFTRCCTPLLTGRAGFSLTPGFNFDETSMLRAAVLRVVAICGLEDLTRTEGGEVCLCEDEEEEEEDVESRLPVEALKFLVTEANKPTPSRFACSSLD